MRVLFVLEMALEVLTSTRTKQAGMRRDQKAVDAVLLIASVCTEG